MLERGDKIICKVRNFWSWHSNWNQTHLPIENYWKAEHNAWNSDTGSRKHRTGIPGLRRQSWRSGKSKAARVHGTDYWRWQRYTERKAWRCAANTTLSSIQRNTDDCMPERKLHKLGKELADKIEGTAPGVHPRPGIGPVPTSHTGKLIIHGMLGRIFKRFCHASGE